MMCNTSVVYKKKRWAAFDMIAFDGLQKQKKNKHVLKQDNKRR